MVVDVVLALDLIARMREHAAQRIAQRGPTAVAHVHGANGVRGHELDLGLQALAHVGTGEVHALRARLGKHGVLRGDGQVEVDEARSRDLDLLDVLISRQVRNHRIGDLAGRRARELRGAHGHGGGPLAVRGISRSLDAAIVQLERRQLTCLDSCSKGGTHQLFDLLGHESSSMDAPGGAATAAHTYVKRVIL